MEHKVIELMYSMPLERVAKIGCDRKCENHRAFRKSNASLWLNEVEISATTRNQHEESRPTPGKTHSLISSGKYARQEP
jgi:hypothetical protein